MNSSDPRDLAQALIRVLVCAVVLSGCGAGQQSQTATIAPAVNGAMATIDDIGLHNIRLRAERTRYATLQPGTSIDLALVVTNQSSATADAVVAITSDIGAVTVTGNATVPADGTLIIDSPDRLVHADALAAVKPVNMATATVILTKPITYGLIYEFTFRFAHAGQTTVGVPVSVD